MTGYYRKRAFLWALLVAGAASVAFTADRAVLAQPSGATLAITTSSFAEGTGSARWGRAEGLVQASFARVVATLEDYARYASVFPHFRSSRVLSRRGASALVYGEASCVGTDYWVELRMSATTDRSGARLVEAHMTRGSVTRFVARWRVEPAAEGSSVRVRLEVVTDANLPVPRSLITAHNVAAARMGIEALRTRTRAATASAR